MHHNARHAAVHAIENSDIVAYVEFLGDPGTLDLDGVSKIFGIGGFDYDTATIWFARLHIAYQPFQISHYNFYSFMLLVNMFLNIFDWWQNTFKCLQFSCFIFFSYLIFFDHGLHFNFFVSRVDIINFDCFDVDLFV